MFSLHSITLHHRLSIRGIIYTLYMQNIIRMIIGHMYIYICIYAVTRYSSVHTLDIQEEYCDLFVNC